MGATTTIRVKLSRQRVKRVLRLLPRLLSGRVPDPTGRVIDLQIALGFALLQLFQEAYKVKARGGIDEAGDEWKPLAPSTIARRLRRGRRPGDIQKLRELWERFGWGEFDEAAVEILIDTGKLFRSLTPGVRSKDQVFEVRPGEIIVGTNAVSERGFPYPAAHHHGTVNLPQRRLWPQVSDWPPRWHEVIRDVFQRGVALLIRDLLMFEANRGQGAL